MAIKESNERETYHEPIVEESSFSLSEAADDLAADTVIICVSGC